MRNQLALGVAALLAGWGLREHGTMLLATGESWRLVHTLGISLTAIGGFAVVAALVRWIAHARGEEAFLELELSPDRDTDTTEHAREPGPSLRVRRNRRRRQRAEYLASLKPRNLE